MGGPETGVKRKSHLPDKQNKRKIYICIGKKYVKITK